jgi:hypothetical protein
LWGDTSHKKIKKRFDLPNLGVQKCHHYKYDLVADKTTGEVTVNCEIWHHNDLETPGLRTKWAGSSSDDAYKKWVEKEVFVPKKWKEKGVFSREYKPPRKQTAERDSSKSGGVVEAVSAYRKTMASATQKWAASAHATSEGASAKMMAGRSLHSPSGTERVPTSGWAVKKPLPSVSFPMPMKKLLLTYFNVIPRISPEDAVKRMRAENPADVYIEYVVTAGRVKGYFSRFKKHKDDKQIGRSAPCPEEACGGEAQMQYNGCGDVSKLAKEIRKRGIGFGTLQSIKQLGKGTLIGMLLENDEGKDAAGENRVEEEHGLEMGRIFGALGDLEEGGDEGDDEEDPDGPEDASEDPDTIELLAEMAE